MNQSHDMFAIVSPGLETECAAELERLGVEGGVVQHGGVAFRGGRRELQLANLWLRTASRVLLRLASFRCRDFPQLFKRCRDLPWGSYVRPGTPLEVAASSHRSRLIHSERLAVTVREAVDHALGRGAGGGGGFTQRIQLRLEDDLCTVSLDSSGELLHRRGYRSESGAAPLRETLAAGILMRLGWDGREALVDPMCGSGTFLVEGALLAGAIPPGEQREFAFMHWPRFRPGGWQALLQQTASPVASWPPLLGAEIDAGVLERAGRNAARAGVAEHLGWCPGGFANLEPPAPAGLLVANPPYGERLGEGDALRALYREFGALLRERFSGWRYGFLCPDPGLARLTGLPLRTAGRFSNGGLGVELFAGEIPRR